MLLGISWHTTKSFTFIFSKPTPWFFGNPPPQANTHTRNYSHSTVSLCTWFSHVPVSCLITGEIKWTDAWWFSKIFLSITGWNCFVVMATQSSHWQIQPPHFFQPFSYHRQFSLSDKSATSGLIKTKSVLSHSFKADSAIQPQFSFNPAIQPLNNWAGNSPSKY